MRVLGMILIAAGLLSFVFSMTGTRILPPGLQSPELALLGAGVGIVFLWLAERDRQRRQWKGLKNRPKYFD